LTVKMKKISIMFMLVAVACTSKMEAPKEILKPVKFQTTEMAGGSFGRTFSGSAKAGVETKLSFRVAGIIRHVNAKVGQKVNKGDLIATLDPSDYQLSYEEADASVKNADAQEKKAKSNYERVSILYENKNTSLAEYEAEKAEFESARANQKVMKQRRKQAESQVSYTRLYAPVSGIVNNVYIEENENVTIGGHLVTISSGDDLEVLVGIPEAFISHIQQNQQVNIRFSSLTNQEFKGAVSEISYALSSETAIYPVTVILENTPSVIRPGMAADVTFNFEDDHAQPVLMVSPSAVGEDQNGNFVFVLEQSLDETYIARKRMVEIGALSVGGFEIQSGLKENELVATAGLQTLLDGMKVTLYQAATL